MVYDNKANGMHLMDWSHNCSVAHKNMYTSDVCKTILFQIGSISYNLHFIYPGITKYYAK